MPLTTADIDHRIREADTRLAKLYQERGEVSLALAEGDDTAAGKRLRALRNDIEEAEALLEGLRDARVEAQRRETVEARRQQLAENAKYVAEGKAATRRFAEKLAEVDQAFAEFDRLLGQALEHREQALAWFRRAGVLETMTQRGLRLPLDGTARVMENKVRASRLTALPSTIFQAGPQSNKYTLTEMGQKVFRGAEAKLQEFAE